MGESEIESAHCTGGVWLTGVRIWLGDNRASQISGWPRYDIAYPFANMGNDLSLN